MMGRYLRRVSIYACEFQTMLNSYVRWAFDLGCPPYCKGPVDDVSLTKKRYF